jgi:VWFA-related protein
MKILPAALLAGMGISFASGLPAQQSSSPNEAPMTLHARAKIVVVDVTVTDPKGHAVHGLQRDQFTLTEDHKPQQLKAFEEHSAPTAAELAKAPPIPSLPPGIFTNYVPAPADGAPLNILLLDALNTPLTAQQYVRQQLLDYVKHETPGTHVAIFGLSTQLVLLQGFTADPNLLRQVIAKQSGKGSSLLDNVVGGEGITDSLADQVAASQPPTPGSGLANSNAAPSDLVSNLRTFEDMQTSFQTRLRIQYTLDALNDLARYLANIPGRKNLIWFSGAFPINILPESDGASDPFAAMVNMEREYRETTNLLTRAQVAVYPVDARGLQTSPVFNATTPGTRYNANPQNFNRDQQRFATANAGEHQTMEAMASDTGGHAFYNTNGLTEAVEKAIDDGANYYTLAYTPTDDRDDGAFRHIDVKLAAPGYTLSYRRGYYADDPDTPKAPSATASSAVAAGASGNLSQNKLTSESLMQKAMQHGVPGSTQIVYTVRVLPDAAPGVTEDTLAPNNVANRQGFLPIKPPYRRYRTDFGTDPSNIVFSKGSDGEYHGSLQFVCFIYQPDGQVLNSVSNEISLSLSPARYLGLMKNGGITFHQEISAPAKGDFSIRTGVQDLTSNHIGSAEFPLSLVNNLKPLPVQAQPTANKPASAPPPP